MKRIIVLCIIAMLCLPAVSPAQRKTGKAQTTAPAGKTPGKSASKKVEVSAPQSRDDIISELVDLAGSAYRFRGLAAEKGGGGGSYAKFKIASNGPKGVAILNATATTITFRKGDVEATLDSTGHVNLK